VFPAQGTRPLFSSVHTILSANLVNAALWVLQHPAPLALEQAFPIRLSPDKQHLRVSGHDARGHSHQALFAVTLELNRIKQRANADFRALLAVHEAGHGLVYSLLLGQAPQEMKINIASFEGGYNSFAGLKVTTRQNALDMVCVGLAGRAAEEQVFGASACTTGAEQDFKQATADAARFLRHHGFGQRLSHTDVTVERDHHINTDVEPSNAAIEALLQAQYQRAHQLLGQHRAALVALVEGLMAQGMVSPQDMAQLLARHGISVTHQGSSAANAEDSLILEPFARHWQAFRDAA
jgi:hypothetical protein